jgi:hypothetical protein
VVSCEKEDGGCRIEDRRWKMENRIKYLIVDFFIADRKAVKMEYAKL